MLHEFLTAHRSELIAHCREKVARRYGPERVPQVVDHGVPLFLQQLVDTLKSEQATTARSESQPGPSPVPSEIGRAATIHGTELLRLGYTVDQVVHHYGDFCQAVTELAVKKTAPVTPDEFRTLNRCLDEAIADAVTAFTDERENAILQESTNLHLRLGKLADDHKKLVEIAVQTLGGIQSGTVGVAGATGLALVSTLMQLRDLVEAALPEIRLMSGMTTLRATPFE